MPYPRITTPSGKRAEFSREQAVSSARFILRKAVSSSSEALLRENPCFLGILHMGNITHSWGGSVVQKM